MTSRSMRLVYLNLGETGVYGSRGTVSQVRLGIGAPAGLYTPVSPQFVPMSFAYIIKMMTVTVTTLIDSWLQESFSSFHFFVANPPLFY